MALANLNEEIVGREYERLASTVPGCRIVQESPRPECSRRAAGGG